MLDRKAFSIALAAGLAAQLAMILAGHFVPVIRDRVFMIGGLAIALATGLAYGRLAAAARWPSALLDGGLAAGVSAIIAIGVSVALGDTQAYVMVIGALTSAIAGILGGAAGKLLRPR